jgi:hypothetical protein
VAAAAGELRGAAVSGSEGDSGWRGPEARTLPPPMRVHLPQRPHESFSAILGAGGLDRAGAGVW